MMTAFLKLITKEKGFTLVELLIAATIVALIMPGIVGLLSSFRDAATNDLARQNAVHTASRILEEFKAIVHHSQEENIDFQEIINILTAQAEAINNNDHDDYQNIPGIENIEVEVQHEQNEFAHPRIIATVTWLGIEENDNEPNIGTITLTTLLTL